MSHRGNNKIVSHGHTVSLNGSTGTDVRSMASLLQMHERGPHIKKRPPKNPLNGNPMLKGVVLKTMIRKPKKPNSANRKCVLVRLSNGKEMVAYVPGEGHNLQVDSTFCPRPFVVCRARSEWRLEGCFFLSNDDVDVFCPLSLSDKGAQHRSGARGPVAGLTRRQTQVHPRRLRPGPRHQEEVNGPPASEPHRHRHSRPIHWFSSHCC